MKKTLITLSLVSTALFFANCGGSDNDYVNGAKIHGEDIGTKACECQNAGPAEAEKCNEELNSLKENYEAFMGSVKEDGDVDEVEKAFEEAYKKAMDGC